ncbi:MAG TPA: peptidylprolyl isomerase [Devosiaceae bacterium]
MTRTLGVLILGLFISLGLAAPTLAAVVVTVSGIPITDTQVAQRTKLVQLERSGGSKEATTQLVNEVVMLNEAKRIGVTVSESQIDGAVQNVARNLKLSTDNLGKVLTANGVSMDTLRDRLKASLAWQAVTEQMVQPQVEISDLDLDKEAAGKVTAAMSYDYILKEILFVGAGNGARTATANKYRAGFKGCDSAVQLSTKFPDTAVIDVGRRHATQMPDAVAKELAGLNVGGITKPRVVDNGVSMLAICSKEEARDLTFIKDNLKQEAGNDKMATAADAYLADLKKKARIVYN